VVPVFQRDMLCLFFRKEILRTNKYELLCGSSLAQRMGKGREGRELGILK